MKGLSIPNISIPNVAIPNISFNNGGIDTGTIKNAIMSAIPDISNLTDNIDIQQAASDLLSENLAGGIEIPSELKDMISN